MKRLPGWKRYIVPSWMRFVIFLPCAVGAAVIAYHVIEYHAVQSEIDLLVRQGLARRYKETPGNRALGEAQLLRTRDPEKYVVALQRIQAKYAGTNTALQAMLHETNIDATPVDRRKEIYDEALNIRGRETVMKRWHLARRLTDLDEANGWALHRQLIEDAPEQEYSEGAPLTVIVVGMERTGKGAQIDETLLRFIQDHPDRGVTGIAVEHLARRRQSSPDKLLTTLMPLVRSYPGKMAGITAFRSIRQGLELANQEDRLMEYCRETLSKDTVGRLARQTMAEHYVMGGKIEPALALYRDGEPPDVLALPAAEAGQLADQLALDVKRQEADARTVLSQLAERCLERQMTGNAADLLHEVGERHQKTLAAIPSQSDLTDTERVGFWRAYIAFNGGLRDQGEKQYMAMIEKLKGWYLAQACVNLAELRRGQLQYQQAYDLAGRAGEQLPGDTAVATLIATCQAALARDQQQIEQIARLRAVIAAMDVADVVDESLFKIAEIQVARERPAEAFSELEKVWTEHPQSLHAPAALFRASELCLGPLKRPDEAKRLLEQLLVRYPAHEMSARGAVILKALKSQGGA